MKGVVFTELLDFLDETFSPEMVEEVIEEANLKSGGAYTATGTYDPEEILQLISLVSERTGTPVPDLVAAYGEHLFGRLAQSFPGFFEEDDGAFSLLRRIETTIHNEVRKLYTDAELPSIATREDEPGTMELDYVSPRPFADLAEGLIRGCIKHFGEDISIDREDDAASPGRKAHFRLKKTS